MFRSLALLVAAPVVAFALIACSSSGNDTPPARPSAVPEGVQFIDQDNLRFKPNALTAKVGEAIWFHNSETALHTVTINGTNESGNMKRNATFTWTPSTPGEYKFSCDFHAQMKATITVTE